MEIKNKLTLPRGAWGGDKGEKKGKSHQGICIKDTLTKKTGEEEIECGKCGWVRWKRVMGGK